jgi:WD40 repeat protein
MQFLTKDKLISMKIIFTLLLFGRNFLLLIALFCLLPSSILGLNRPESQNMEMVIQVGHTGGISAMEVFGDDSIFATGGSDRTIKLWSWGGVLIRSFTSGLDAIELVAGSQDGQIIAAYGRGFIKAWSIMGNLLFQKKMSDIPPEQSGVHVRAVKFMGGSNNLAIVTSDGKVTTLNSLGDEISRISLWKQIEAHRLLSFDCSREKNLMVSGDDSDRILVFDGSGVIMATIQCPEGHRPEVTLSGDGNFIVSRGNDRTVLVFKITGERVLKLTDFHSDVSSVDVTFDGQRIVTGGSQHILSDMDPVRIWSLTGKLLFNLNRLKRGSDFVKFSRDGKRVLLSSFPGGIWTFAEDRFEMLPKPPTRLRSIELTPDEKFVFVSGEGIQWWSLSTLYLKGIMGAHQEFGPLAYDPQRGVLFAGGCNQLNFSTKSKRGAVHVYSRFGYHASSFFPGKDDEIKSLAFSSRGKLALGGDSGKVYIIDDNASNSLDIKRSIESLAFNIDNEKLLIGTSSSFHEDDSPSLVYFDVARGKTLFRVDESMDVKHLAIDPRQHYFATIHPYNKVTLWDFKGKPLITFPVNDEGVGSLSVSPKSGWIAAGGEDGKIYLFSSDGTLQKIFKGHSAAVTSLVFSKEGNLLFSSSEDGTLIIRKVKTGESVTLLARDDDWIIFTPDGYFDASRNGGNLLGLTIGNTPHGVDQYSLRFNRPDLILKRMGLGSAETITYFAEKYAERLAQHNIKVNDRFNLKQSPPQAKILTQTKEGDFLKVRFILHDESGGLVSYTFFVNGVPVTQQKSEEVSGESFSGESVIKLSTGRNRIELVCTNSAGLESDAAIVFQENWNAQKGDLYFLGVGISKYRIPELNLNFSDKDAVDLQNSFKKMSASYDHFHSKLFLNDDATGARLENAKTFFHGSTENDTLVLFVSGHGMQNRSGNKKYYFIVHDTDPKDVEKSAMDFEQVESLLRDSPSRKKILLIDTCESGVLDEEYEGAISSIANSLSLSIRNNRQFKSLGSQVNRLSILLERDRFIISDLGRRSGILVFSSSRGGEYSFENPTVKNGYFTYSIIKAIAHGGDTDKDGFIDIPELKQFVFNSVVKLSGDLQHPAFDRDNRKAEILFPVARD